MSELEKALIAYDMKKIIGGIIILAVLYFILWLLRDKPKK